MRHGTEKLIGVDEEEVTEYCIQSASLSLQSSELGPPALSPRKRVLLPPTLGPSGGHTRLGGGRGTYWLGWRELLRTKGQTPGTL